MNLHELIDRLHKEHTLTKEEFITLIKERNEESASYLASLAREEAVNIYGNDVFPQGNTRQKRKSCCIFKYR